MGTVLRAEDILPLKDRELVREEVPEWGGDVFLRPLSGKERDRYEASLLVRKGDKMELSNDNARAKLLALSMCDEAGNLLFNASQIPALGEKNGAVLDRLHDRVEEISGMARQSAKDAEKNSETDPGDASSSD